MCPRTADTPLAHTPAAFTPQLGRGRHVVVVGIAALTLLLAALQHATQVVPARLFEEVPLATGARPAPLIRLWADKVKFTAWLCKK